jgi:hypothetical protein
MTGTATSGCAGSLVATRSLPRTVPDLALFATLTSILKLAVGLRGESRFEARGRRLDGGDRQTFVTVHDQGADLGALVGRFERQARRLDDDAAGAAAAHGDLDLGAACVIGLDDELWWRRHRAVLRASP